jgi:glycosyltransferase involved in cell wall biosynthesis
VNGLLEALTEVPELGLVVVGDGPERPRLERRARELGVSDRVYFAGQRSKKEALSLMAACDLFVLNSAYEGLPHVVLEAMALGLPVVATAVGERLSAANMIRLTEETLLTVAHRSA